MQHSVYDETNTVKYHSLNATAIANTTTGNNNHTIIDAQIMNHTSDDGRINYSNKAPLNMGTKHVVNMLGNFRLSMFLFHIFICRFYNKKLNFKSFQYLHDNS